MKRIILVISLNLILISTFFSQSVGGTTSGTASYCAGNNSGFISLNGYTGNILFWESSTDLISWTNLGNPTPTQSYINLTQTTHYRAIVQDGTFPQDTSSISTITIYIPAEGGIVNGGNTYCVQSGIGTLNITGETGNVLNWMYSQDGGTTWTSINNTTTSYNYPNTTQNTIFSAIVQNEPSCPNDTSEYGYITIDALSESGTLIADDTSLCTGTNQINMNLSGENGQIIDWYFSEDNSSWDTIGNQTNSETINDLQTSTSYFVIVQNGVCPADTTNQIDVIVHEPEPVSAGSDTEINNHETITLNGSGSGTLIWSPSEGMDDPTSATPTLTPTNTTTYTINQTDVNGCLNSDSATITVIFPVPSGFTPNSDGLNDFFVIEGADEQPNNSLVIYNRQGNIVYEKSPYNNTWNGRSSNGKDLPDGIYYYILDWGDGTDQLNGYVLIKR